MGSRSCWLELQNMRSCHAIHAAIPLHIGHDWTRFHPWYCHAIRGRSCFFEVIALNPSPRGQCLILIYRHSGSLSKELFWYKLACERSMPGRITGVKELSGKRKG